MRTKFLSILEEKGEKAYTHVVSKPRALCRGHCAKFPVSKCSLY